MEPLAGPRLREHLGCVDDDERRRLLEKVGEAVGRLHDVGIVHGDLTTSNILVDGEGVALLDFGLGDRSTEDEARGVDLHVLMEALDATHREGWFEAVLDGYRRRTHSKGVEQKVVYIVRRGRYRGS